MALTFSSSRVSSSPPPGLGGGGFVGGRPVVVVAGAVRAWGPVDRARAMAEGGPGEHVHARGLQEEGRLLQWLYDCERLTRDADWGI